MRGKAEYATPINTKWSCMFVQLHMLLKMYFLAHSFKVRKTNTFWNVKGKGFMFQIFHRVQNPEYYSAVVIGSINCYIKANQACNKRSEHQIITDVSSLLHWYIKRIKAFAWMEYSGHNSQLNLETLQPAIFSKSFQLLCII